MKVFCEQCASPLQERLFEGRIRQACPECGLIVFTDPKVAATVMVERDGSILLVRRSIDPARGLWCFPGGYVDFGEDPVVAAIRECREEVGISIADLRLLDVSFNGRVIVITYLASAATEAVVTPGDDADMAAWFVPPQLPPLAFPGVEQAISVWLHGRRVEASTGTAPGADLKIKGGS
jgi:8-oxo-dGTP diphosphatase